MRPTTASRAEHRAHPWARHGSPWAAIACMGIVFGDIGTSPLYTLNVAAKAASPGGSVAHRNAQRPAAYFRIPGSQVMEIGVELEI